MRKIYVDADACPVKGEVEQVATRHKLTVYIVSNGGVRPSQNPFIENIIVDKGADIADMWIAERADKNDIVITVDIPLAARVIESGARVIRHNGEVLSESNIGNVLATRNLMTDIRAANPFQQGNNKAFSKSDRSKFLNALETIIRTLPASAV